MKAFYGFSSTDTNMNCYSITQITSQSNLH